MPSSQTLETTENPVNTFSHTKPPKSSPKRLEERSVELPLEGISQQAWGNTRGQNGGQGETGNHNSNRKIAFWNPGDPSPQGPNQDRAKLDQKTNRRCDGRTQHPVGSLGEPDDCGQGRSNSEDVHMAHTGPFENHHWVPRIPNGSPTGQSLCGEHPYQQPAGECIDTSQ